MDDRVLLVQQLVDMSEIVLPIEARNRYSILDENHEQKYFAYEMRGTRAWAWLLRSLLVSLRPFRLMVIDNDQKPVVSFKKEFRFYFHNIVVYDHEKQIGRVERKFSIINKLFHVFDSDGRFICEIKGPLWKPWTFDIVQNGQQYGKIRKSWRGVLAETFTDADLFGIEFPEGSSVEAKKILLASVFLIDFVYFEGNAGMNYAPDTGI